jgi:hypothetical protein
VSREPNGWQNLGFRMDRLIVPSEIETLLLLSTHPRKKVPKFRGMGISPHESHGLEARATK